GLLMLPFVGGMMLSSLGSGLITSRTGHYRIFPIIGTAMMAIGSLLFCQLEWNSSLLRVDIYMAVFSLGLGLCMQTITLAIQNAVPARDMGVATASGTFFRSMGGTLGTAVFLSMLFSNVTDKIRDAFAGLVPTAPFQAAVHDPAVLTNPDNGPALAMLNSGGGNTGGVLEDSSFIQRLNPVLAQPFQEGFTNAMHIVFVGVAIVAAVGFVLSLITKEAPLRMQSGLQAAAEEAALVNGVEPVAAAVVAGDPGLAAVAVGDYGTIQDQVSTADHGANGNHMSGGNHMSNQSDIEGTQVRGFVRRPDGSPVPYAAVTVIDLGGRQVGRTLTKPDGGYQVSMPADGTYLLVASASSRQPQAATVVVNGAPVDVNVVLTGTAGLSGLITTPDNAPIPKATVTLANARGQVVGTHSTDPAGGYQFTQLAAGDYTLVVSAASYQPAALPLTVTDTGLNTQDVELVGQASLHGVAKATDGQPVANARVALLDETGGVVAVATTGPTGEYDFGDLSEGDYTVIASGYPPVASPLRVSAGEEASHDVELGYPD
ncbi:MAG: carboxypeptidase regulatory-like domain-containing protein, partial [Kutzneria sp.]|nr:carboxypeptidase regulatory-like domain-containing protein [Kutzneria sp.]